jgi:class 3 adenylate cyclase/predicted ATPase
VEEWLRSIGLAGRIAAFRDNGITPADFRDLTESDLRELGLTIGERKRFLRALAAEAAQQAAAPTTPAAATLAERRPLTVMFVDLVGSTSLGERIDAEDLIEVMRCYRELAGAAIARFGGHIARFTGDGILAYFCYPIANENDPERAVRAALEIVQGINSVATPTGEKLQIRIGLATGRVIVSDLQAGGAADPRTIVGSTANLAARLQSLAPPNGIVISSATYERVQGRFACTSMGPVEVRGFERSHQPWRVERELRRGQAGPGRLFGTEFQGRDDELDMLRRLWSGVERGDGAAVLLVGEPGIGKSRLIAQFLQSHLPDEAQVIYLDASAFDQDSPLRPLADYLRATAGLEVADPPAAALAKLEAVLVGDAATRKRAAIILALLAGVAVDAADRPRLLPDQLREQTVAVLIDQLLLHAERQPVCIVVEDLHWLDPTSAELLDAFIPRLRERRILLLLSGREVAAGTWSAKVDATWRLGRFNVEQVSAMLRDLFADRPVPQALAREIANRTDGVPLFVEEVARLLMAREHPGDEDAVWEIPASLDESLMARLDRSGPAKEIAQAAAVVGRSVRRDVLAAVCALEPDALEASLTALTVAGVLERGEPPLGNFYRFHHALLRDAAYASLLRDRKRELHARVAAALQEVDPDLVELNPEMLALHLTEGGMAERAAPYWMEAARRSLARSAQTEATRLLRRGLVALERLPATRETMNLRLRLSALLGPALIGLHGPNAPETQELYTSAHALSQLVPEEPEHFPIAFGWWRLTPTSVARAQTLLKRAEAHANPEMLLQAHHCSWASHMQIGSFKRCCDHVDAGLAIYERGDFRHHARLYGNHDPKVCALGARCQVYWMQGRLRSALDDERECLRWADRLDHLGSRVHAMSLTLLHRVYRREYREVFDRAGALMTLTAEHGLADHGSAGLIFQGWVKALTEDAAAGLAILEDGLSRQHRIVTNEDFSLYLCLHAEALTRAGRPTDAVERILEGLREFERGDLRIWVPELLRVLGDTMLAADPNAIEAARQRYAEAAAMARAQEVPMLAMRVALSEMRLAARLGDAKQAAQRVLAAVDALPEPDGSDEPAEARVVAMRVLEATLAAL